MPVLPRNQITVDEITDLTMRPDPYWVESEATPRGLMIQTMLRWLQSDNTYINPITKQQFHVEIKTRQPETHKFVQDQIRVAARVIHVGDMAEIVPELGTMEWDQEPNNAVTHGETPLADNMSTGQGEGQEGVEAESIELSFTVLDAKDVKPPYCILFAFEPPTESVADNTDLTDETNDESDSTSHPIPQPTQRKPFTATRINLPYTLLCTCTTISGTMQIQTLLEGSSLTATYYSVSRDKVLKVQKKASVGELPLWHNGPREKIRLSINPTGQATYSVSGFHAIV